VAPVYAAGMGKAWRPNIWLLRKKRCISPENYAPFLQEKEERQGGELRSRRPEEEIPAVENEICDSAQRQGGERGGAENRFWTCLGHVYLLQCLMGMISNFAEG
jgi:hypothetical protein